MQQDIARHAQVGVQAAIHDQCGQISSIAKKTHTYAKTTCRYRPDHHDIRALPAVHQRVLAKVGHPEEEPQTIIGDHGEDLHPEGDAIFHGRLHIGNHIGAYEAQRAHKGA